MFSENVAVYEKMWKNTVQLDRSEMTIWHKRIACWITKATNTHSICVIFITFPLQQWLLERASSLRCTYIVCLVSSKNKYCELFEKFRVIYI